MDNRRIFLEKLFFTTSILIVNTFLEKNNIALADTKNALNFFPSLIYEITNSVAEGIGEGVGNLLKDWIDSNNPYKIQQRQEIINLFQQTLKEYQNYQIDLRLLAIQGNWDQENWSGILDRYETEKILQQKDALLLLFAPPNMSQDLPNLILNNLALDFRTIPTELMKFYSESSNGYKVKIYTDYFKKTIGNIIVKQLYEILCPIPTAIFYTDITDYNCQFSVGFWDLKSIEPKIISSDLWNWEVTFNILKQSEINEKDCLRKIRQLIITVNQLLASYFIDISFLKINPLYELKFPKFAQKLLAEQFDQKILSPLYIETLKQKQVQQINILDNFKSQIQQVNNSIVESAGKWKISTKFPHLAEVRCLTINPTENVIIAPKNSSINFYNFYGQLIQQLECQRSVPVSYCSHSILTVICSSDGKNIIYGGDRIVEAYGLVNPPYFLNHVGNINCIAAHPSENIIATASDDKKVKIWHFEKNKFMGIYRMKSAVLSVEFSPDGQLLAMATKEGYISLVNIYTQKIVLNSSRNQSILCLKFTLDSKILLTGDSDKNITLWDVKTGQLIRVLKGHLSSINSLVFSKDGLTLFSASVDRSIKLWNWKTGECVRTLEGHIDSVNSIALSSDGHTLVSGSKDSTITIWQNN